MSKETQKKENPYNHITITTRELFQLARTCYMANKPLFVLGDYGIGKTSIAKKIAELMQANHFVAFNSSDQSLFDVQMPYVEDDKKFPGVKRTKFAVSTKIPLEGRTFIFVDEINVLPAAMQPPLYQLILEGKIGDVSLPTDNFRMAAGNRLWDRCAAQVMSAALPDRFGVVCNLEPDIDSWSEYAYNSNILPEVISFAKAFPECLTGQDPDDPCAGCTPRSLEALSDMLKQERLSSKVENVMIRGSIGKKFGSAFCGHLQLFRDNVHVAEIIKNPDKFPVPDKTNVVYGICCALSQELNVGNADKISRYINRIPKSFQTCFWQDAVTRNNEYNDLPCYNKWLSANQELFY